MVLYKTCYTLKYLVVPAFSQTEIILDSDSKVVMGYYFSVKIYWLREKKKNKILEKSITSLEKKRYSEGTEDSDIK